MTENPEQAHLLGEFIDRSPTPFHAVQNAVQLLDAAGFEPFAPTAGLRSASSTGSGSTPGNGYVQRDGALIAWVDGHDPTAPARYIVAHTDSPNLRIRPRPDTGSNGIRQLAVEVYGGALLNSWLDRDLGLAGRVSVRADTGVQTRLFRSPEPQLRVPQLAIHLDREINERGLQLDRQRHLTPIWSLGNPRHGLFREWLAEQVGVVTDDVLGWDVSCFDFQSHSILGSDAELLAAARLDNLAGCVAGLEALIGARETARQPAVLMLFDHEEVGSATPTGADSMFPDRVLEQRAAALGVDRQSWLASLDGSIVLSADMAHATHPNYPERHEPSHSITLGAGPVIKHNVNARYATDSRTAAEFKRACHEAGVEYQEYSHRGDLPCGSTIGPLVASRLSIPTVDVGAAQLSMHSAREMMAVADVEKMVRAFSAWMTPKGL